MQWLISNILTEINIRYCIGKRNFIGVVIKNFFNNCGLLLSKYTKMVYYIDKKGKTFKERTGVCTYSSVNVVVRWCLLGGNRYE